MPDIPWHCTVQCLLQITPYIMCIQMLHLEARSAQPRIRFAYRWLPHLGVCLPRF